MSGPVRDSASNVVPVASGQPPYLPTPEYWDQIAGAWCPVDEARAWRMVSDAVNARLLTEWLAPNAQGSVLKTDLFDEVASSGLVPWLSASFAHVAGVDVSPALVDIVRARFPGLHVEVSDVRTLPFPDGTFDTVVSNSTLDHFPSRRDIATALNELHRVMRSGGTLLVTLDNPLNPVVAIRNMLPERFRAASGLVPFSVGATCGPRRLRAMLQQTGFEVTRLGATFHCPRVLVVLGGHFIDRRCGPAGKRRYVRLWTAFEVLASLPTRFITGHFVAALARKP